MPLVQAAERTRVVRALRAAVALIALAGGWPATGSAQDAGSPSQPQRPGAAGQADVWAAPRWVGDVTFLASNALVAGLTAGVSQRLRGGDFRDGFARGALGGAVAYAGRRIGAEGFDGAGLVGRQVSAVGVSMARNAGDGRPSLERLMFPLGPVHLYVDRSAGLAVRPKLHVVGLAQATRLALRDETAFDWGATLSAGAPVFRAPGRRLIFDDYSAVGLALHGSIVLGEDDRFDPDRLFAHERVHILQSDFAFLTWSEPIEAWLSERHRYARTVYRYLDFGGVLPLAALGASRLGAFTFHGDWPHELEARFLEAR